MTRKRDLGPPLAIAGAVVAIGAVIAGFVVVGGPGDARARRLDDLTMEKLRALASEAQCAFAATGETYRTVTELKAVADRIRRTDGPALESACGHINPDVQPDEVGDDDNPDHLGDITYAAIDSSHIRLCGNFRRAYSSKDRAPSMFSYRDFPAFAAARPAGKHCYELELLPPVKSRGGATDAPAPEPLPNR